MQRLEQIGDRAHADPAVRNADPSLGPKVHHDLGAHTARVPDDVRFSEKKLSYEIFHILNAGLVYRWRIESKSPLPPFLKGGIYGTILSGPVGHWSLVTKDVSR